MATTTFNDLITFSRGSNATVTGPNGLIQWAPSNSLTSSQSFTTSGWVVDGAVVTPSTGVAPDGTTTATGIALGTGNTRVYQFDNSGVLGNKVFSLYVKADVGSTVAIRAVGGMTPGGLATVNAATGAVSGLAGASSVSVGSGWYRVSVPVNVGTASGNSTYWTIEGTGGAVFIWGAQLELGSTATTYNNTSVRNLLGFSEAFDNAAWTKTRASIVTGAQANPVNGLFNAQKLMVDTATGSHRVISGAGATASGARHTFSVYIKQGEYAKAAIGEFNNGVGWASFDLQAGTVLATGGTGSPSASITTAGNGWFRCAVTCTVGAFSRLDIYALNAAYTTADPSVYSYTGDGNSGVYIYGAMLSNSASLDPYVPTPGAAPSSTAYYGPRFDYDPVTLLPRGFLVEEARTNLLTYSEQFDNAAWTKGSGGAGVAAVVTANTATAPDGTLTADRVQLNAGGTTINDFSFVQQTVTGLANPHSAARTVWMRSNTGASFLVAIRENGTNTFSVVTVGNTWTRFEYSSGSIAAIGDGIQIILRGTYGTSQTADILVWGAQLEAGAFATSYIPTIASTVTRSADVATITGSLFSQWYSQQTGTFIVTAASLATGTAFITSADDNTANNSIVTYASGVDPRFAVTTGGAAQANIDAGTITANTPFALAGAYAVNDFAASIGGGAVVTDTAGTIPTVDRLRIGAGQGGLPLNNYIRSIRYVPVRAADFQLQQVTT